MLPVWIVSLLLGQIDRLEAEELEKSMIAASTPHMREAERKDVLRKLHRSRPAIRDQQPETPVSEQDPEKAREWFVSIGAQVM